jgi:hypothetical protein
METGRQIDPNTPTYLVERYWPGVDEPTLRDCLRRLEEAALRMSALGRPVRHIGSLLIADDEVVFSVIQASSEPDVRHVNELAGLLVDRISAASPHGLGIARSVADRTGDSELQPAAGCCVAETEQATRQ